jgi:hypothetical protein
VRAGAQIGHERSDISAAHMHVPADEHDIGHVRDSGVARTASSPAEDMHGLADARAPCVQSRALACIVWCEPLKPR